MKNGTGQRFACGNWIWTLRMTVRSVLLQAAFGRKTVRMKPPRKSRASTITSGHTKTGPLHLVSRHPPAAPSTVADNGRRRADFVSAFRVPHSVPSKCLPPAIGGYGLRGTQGCPTQACIQRAAVVNCTGSLHRLQRPVLSFIRTRARSVAPGRAADAGGEGGDLVGGPCALKLTIALRAAIKNDDVEIGR